MEDGAPHGGRREEEEPQTAKRPERGLFQDARGNWVVEWYEGLARKRKLIGPRKSEAIAFQTRTRERLRLAKIFPEREEAKEEAALRKLTVGDLVDPFAAQLRNNNRSWKSPQKSGEVAAAYFGSKPIYKITAEDIEAFKIHRLSCRVDRKYKDPQKHEARPTLKPATVNRDLARLKTLFNLAVKNKLLSVNPMAKAVKMLAEENMRYDYLTPAQQKLFRPHLPAAKYRMRRFNCLTWLRTTELLTLSRSYGKP